MMRFTSIAILSVSCTVATFAIPIPSAPHSDEEWYGLYSLTTQLSYAVADDNVTVFSRYAPALRSNVSWLL